MGVGKDLPRIAIKGKKLQWNSSETEGRGECKDKQGPIKSNLFNSYLAISKRLNGSDKRLDFKIADGI